jgi:hypothetical protein
VIPAASASRPPADHGGLPPWNVGDLPAPPPFTTRNLLKVIGPGAIMAATSIGGGEWLVGPAAAVKYSTSIFLIASVAIVLQVVFNLEAIRYTLYTGEPIYGGIMRLRPGPRFWAGFYTVMGFFQLGWPALAGSAAATLFGAWMGRMPGAPDQSAQSWIATALIVVVVLILSFGGTIERMLEYFAWSMLGIVFLFLIAVNVAFVPLSHSWQTFTGFFSIAGLQQPIDWGHRPAFFITTIATIAVAIAANTLIFALVRHVLLTPLPLPDPNQLVLIEETYPTGRTNVTGATFIDLAARSRSLKVTGAFRLMPAAVSTAGAGGASQCRHGLPWILRRARVGSVPRAIVHPGRLPAGRQSHRPPERHAAPDCDANCAFRGPSRRRRRGNRSCLRAAEHPRASDIDLRDHAARRPDTLCGSGAGHHHSRPRRHRSRTPRRPRGSHRRAAG